jgi:hypothetical protein
MCLSTAAFANPPACDTTQQLSCASWSGWSQPAWQCTPCGAGSFGGEICLEKEEQFEMCWTQDGTQCIQTQTHVLAERISCM